MTSCNRSKQTYYTLQTINESEVKGIHVILVDDSDADSISLLNLQRYKNINFDFISINQTEKNWANPMVNYNIGFMFVNADLVVIQNAEVCHVGDVLKHVLSIEKDDLYYVFDVKASRNFETNEKIYQKGYALSSDIFQEESLFYMWYQSKIRNTMYHFLTAMSINTFKK